MPNRLLIPHHCQRVVAYAVAMVVLLASVNNPANAVAAETGAEKPNILLIVADDLGYADVGFHGGKEIPTPHIDSITAGGVQFTNGYVTCPVCSPTRARAFSPDDTNSVLVTSSTRAESIRRTAKSSAFR